MRSCYKLVLLVLFILSKPAFSATQGNLGATSTGTVNVTITIPPLVQISALSDIALSSTSTFSATGSTTACIYSNVATPLGSYYITATSLNASGGNFRVKDNGTDVITYSAYWGNTATAMQTAPALVSGTKSAQQTGANTNSPTCGTSTITPTANFNINFSAAQLQVAPAATYTDVVTLLITPS